MTMLELLLLPDLFAVCRLDKDAPAPANLSGNFLSITRTADELSIVCRQDLGPADARCERGWRCMRVAGTIDFATVGVVASLANPLTEASIGVFIVSTFDTDYVLVKEVDLDRALIALRSAGHDVR